MVSPHLDKRQRHRYGHHHNHQIVLCQIVKEQSRFMNYPAQGFVERTQSL